MSGSVGKLKNRESGESLDFSNAPMSFQLNREYEFESEPLVGQPAPAVAFKCGSASVLSFSLSLDTDADSAQKPSTALGFLKSLDKINDDTLSAPVVEFQMGRFSFSGYVRSYHYEVVRFDSEGEATSLNLNLQLISNGEFENAK